MDWRDDGACVGADPELFFPIGRGKLADRQVAQAKAICQRCPVISVCAHWAVATGQHGVWGGLDDDERSRMRQTSRQFAVRSELAVS